MMQIDLALFTNDFSFLSSNRARAAYYEPGAGRKRLPGLKEGPELPGRSADGR
jgi:hypothetical protein